MPDSSFPSKRLTYLLEIIADEAIAGNDAIFLRALGYSIREMRVLRIVDDMPGTTFVEIWEKSGLERSLTSRILQKLIGDGLLLRTSSGTDARKYHLSTTPRGQALRHRGRALSDALEALLLDPFPAADRARLFEQVERLGRWVRSDDYRAALERFDAGLPAERD
ncbi:MarR family winged helix-turn-helix transcriptional regulator [Tabrizicola aquatica]|jgi:DNA-binding MarR family transcriptional regulator|uniref:MarR family winged helix-turn-helix transcriptional regulator n=1 Tax=Tabrizicola aquatica TaxID=909926 RepID=UPI000CD3202A|nr:MarR family winged helix-turn-helix transcriptional regulator [Tabrizicola aquatica]